MGVVREWLRIQTKQHPLAASADLKRRIHFEPRDRHTTDSSQS